MVLKDLELHIRKIFNINDLIVREFDKEPCIYLPSEDGAYIDIMKFFLDNKNNVRVQYHDCSFNSIKNIEYLNDVKKALEVSILWQNDFIQKAVKELVKEYMEA